MEKELDLNLNYNLCVIPTNTFDFNRPIPAPEYGAPNMRE
jgi:hypothetical protein